MPDLTIGDADRAARINVASPLLGNHTLGLDHHLSARLTDAIEAAVDAVLEEKRQDDLKAAVQVDAADTRRALDTSDDARTIVNAGSADADATGSMTDGRSETGVEASTDHDNLMETAGANLEFEIAVQERARAAMQEFSDQVARRGTDLDVLSGDELAGMARSMLVDEPLVATCEAHQAALEQQATEARDTLERMARALEGSWPLAASESLRDHIATVVVGRVDAAAAEADALDILDCAAASVAELVARSTQDAAATFDAHLTMAYSQRLLDEQITAAHNAVAQELAQLPEVSGARKTGEAILAIAAGLPQAPADTREALERYYALLADQKSHLVATDMLDRLLAAPEDLLLDYVVKLQQEDDFNLRVVEALSDDAAVSARARERIEESDVEVTRTRAPRISPFPDGIDGPTSFHLATADVIDHVHAEILKLEDLSLAVELHAEARLRNVWAVLHAVDALKVEGTIAPGDPVSFGRAVFQFGRGVEAEDTEAAHKLPAQLYIGVDQKALDALDDQQRAQHRLDIHLQHDAELAGLARVSAGSTTVMPAFVNKVDSDWERAGLREAFTQAVQELIDADIADAAAVYRAFETFRFEAAAAIQTVAERYEAERAQRAEQEAGTLHETQLERKAEVAEHYRAVLAAMDANEARARFQHWLALVNDRERQA